MPVQSFLMKCLKLKCDSGNVLEDTPKHLPDDIDNFCLSDIIAGPSDCHLKGLTKVWSTELWESGQTFQSSKQVWLQSFLNMLTVLLLFVPVKFDHVIKTSFHSFVIFVF